jgi:hypothetical protein
VDDELFEYAIKLFNDREIPYDTYHDYYNGDHTLNFATNKFRNTFGATFRAFALNLCPLVVDTLADRIRLEGFDVEPDPESDIQPDDGTILTEIERLWTFNRMDRRQHEVHHEAFRCGDSYTIVWPDPVTGIPVIWPQDPAQIIVGVNVDNPNLLNWAFKIYRTSEEYVRVTVYLPEGIWKYQSINRNRTGRISVRLSDYEPLRIEGESWPVPNPLLQVPVFPFRNNSGNESEGRSELRDLIPVQDAINKTLMDMIVGQEYFSLPQRWVTGIEPTYDSHGKEVAPFDSVIGKLWTAAAKDVNFGQFPAADVSMLQKNADGLIEKFAIISRIPLHYITPMTGDRWPSGEAVALDTPVPTPHGFIPLGDITVGEQVYDEQGNIQIVEHVFAVLHDRPCYRVVFDDGSSIVADASHKWLTETQRERKNGWGGSVRTTEELAQSVFATNASDELLRSGRNHTPMFNHSIPVAQPLQGEDIDLPIEPYAFGVWLGDGCHWHGTITQHRDDAPDLVAALQGAGTRAYAREVGRENTVAVVLDRVNESGRCRRGHERPAGTQCPECAHLAYRHRYYGEELPEQTNLSFRGQLQRAGVHRNKHIPEIYFQASHAQRLAVLQGLLDTDGSTALSGSVTLDLNHERLAKDAHRLIQSLGHKCALRQGRERDGSPRWRMAWSAPEPVFRLPRKVDRQRLVTSGPSRRRYIRSVEPVDSVPVRCIAVSGPSHLFLIGEAHVPTHNSLKTAEASFVAKLIDRQTLFGNSWEDTFSFALRQMGLESVSLSSTWADPNPRAETEKYERLSILMRTGLDAHTAAILVGMPQDIIDAISTREVSAQELLPEREPVTAPGEEEFGRA